MLLNIENKRGEAIKKRRAFARPQKAMNIIALNVKLANHFKKVNSLFVTDISLFSIGLVTCINIVLKTLRRQENAYTC